MADYRLLLAELSDGTILGELPAESFSWTEVLNGAGSFTVSLPLDGRRSEADPYTIINNQDLTFDCTRAVYIERDGVVLWGGIVWTASGSVSTNTLTLAGEGFWSYLRRRYISGTLTYSSSTDDQLSIARDLVHITQNTTGEGINLDISDTNLSGRKRDRTYYGFERKQVAEAIEQIAAVEDGFDFRVETTNASGSIVNYFRTYYPATGRATDHVLEVGTNIQVLNFRIDGTTVVNRVDAVGAGEGQDLLIGTASTPALGGAPVLQDVLSHSDVRDASTLVAHARRRLTRGSAPITNLQVSVLPETVPPFGSYAVGDIVRVRGSYGFLDVDDQFRIVNLAVSVNVNGSEDVTLDLVPLEVFA